MQINRIITLLLIQLSVAPKAASVSMTGDKSMRTPSHIRAASIIARNRRVVEGSTVGDGESGSGGRGDGDGDNEETVGENGSKTSEGDGELGIGGTGDGDGESVTGDGELGSGGRGDGDGDNGDTVGEINTSEGDGELGIGGTGDGDGDNEETVGENGSKTSEGDGELGIGGTGDGDGESVTGGPTSGDGESGPSSPPSASPTAVAQGETTGPSESPTKQPTKVPVITPTEAPTSKNDRTPYQSSNTGSVGGEKDDPKRNGGNAISYIVMTGVAALVFVTVVKYRRRKRMMRDREIVLGSPSKGHLNELYYGDSDII